MTKKCQHKPKYFKLAGSIYSDFQTLRQFTFSISLLYTSWATLLRFWDIKTYLILPQHFFFPHYRNHFLGDVIQVSHCQRKSQATALEGECLPLICLCKRQTSDSSFLLSRWTLCIMAVRSPEPGQHGQKLQAKNLLAHAFETRIIFLCIFSPPATCHSSMMDPVNQDVKGTLGVWTEGART